MAIYEDPSKRKRPVMNRQDLRESACKFAYNNGLVLTGEEAEGLFSQCYPDWGFNELPKDPNAVLDCSAWEDKASGKEV